MKRRATRSTLVAAIAILAAWLASSFAHAHPTARLRYSVASDVVGCPDEADLRLSVARRLGYDPFESASSDVVVAKIASSAGGLVGTVELLGGAGKSKGAQTLASKTRDCAELAESMTLAMAIAIDPLAAMAPPPATSSPVPSASTSTEATAAPLPVPSTTPIDDHPPSPPPHEDDPTAWLPRFGLGAFVAAGTAPTPTPGLVALVGASFGHFALQLEGRADLPASHDGENGGRIRAGIYLATLAPCLESRILFGCALLSVGALHGVGQDVDVSRSGTALYAATGARVGVEVPLGGALHLRPFLEGMVTLRGASLTVNHAEAWSTPFGAATLGLSLVYFH